MERLGRLVVLSGPNGSGKTRVLNLLEKSVLNFASNLREQDAKQSMLTALGDHFSRDEIFATTTDELSALKARQPLSSKASIYVR
jgi:predicted ATP-binding protein involved in virulence